MDIVVQNLYSSQSKNIGFEMCILGPLSLL